MYSPNKVHKEVRKTLKEASELVKQAYHGRVKTSEKSGGQSLSTSIVTQTDIEVERLLQARLQKLFPEAGFILEETEETNIKEYNWIIDPIDGTLNFAKKTPIFGISVALWRENEPLYGIVSFPLQNEIIYAMLGQGAYLNESQIEKTKSSINEKPYVLYAHVGDDSQEKLKVHSEIIKIVPFPRSFGCATFTVVSTVLGRADCAILINMSLWDIAAVVLIAQEAGLSCEFISPYPDVFSPNVRDYANTLVIGEKRLAKEVAKKVKIGLGTRK